MITASIQFKSHDDLKKFLVEFKESIKHPWEIDKENKKLGNKSFLKHKIESFSVFFVDTKNDTILKGNISLGIFSSYIKILSVSVDKKGLDKGKNEHVEIGLDNQYYGYIVHEFINTISALNTFILVENTDLFVKIDLHQQVEDLRMTRPVSIKDQKTNKIYTMNRIEINKINRRTFEFVPPNNIALLLNISKRELEDAQEIYTKKIMKYFGNKSSCKFENEKLSDLYNYFERIQSSLIFSYSAVEALCNAAIPANYEYEFINNKGVKEIWNKVAIERHLRTSDKLKDHLPKILKVKAPINEPFWGRFNVLEEIRNNLIHQKTGDEKSAKSAYQDVFLKDTIFNIIYSGFELIEYFCNANTKHSFFPMGISNSDIEINEVDDISKSFSKYK